MGGYLKLSCQYELHISPNTRVSPAKDYGENYIKVRPPLVRHLLRNRPICHTETSSRKLLTHSFLSLKTLIKLQFFWSTKTTTDTFIDITDQVQDEDLSVFR